MAHVASRSTYAAIRLVSRHDRVREADPPFGLSPRQKALRLKEQIEESIASFGQPVLYKDDRRLGGPDELGWELEVIGGRLLLGLQLDGKWLLRRVIDARARGDSALEITTRCLNRLEIFVLAPDQTLGESADGSHLRESRKQFQALVEETIRRNFPFVRILRSTLYSDLEHSLSGKFVRLLFNSGPCQWMTLAVHPQEDQSTVDGILTAGLLWRDHLKAQRLKWTGKLLLLVPAGRHLIVQSRLGWIRGGTKQIQLMEMNCERRTLTLVDPADRGNLDTMLSSVHVLKARPDYARGDLYQRIIALAARDIEPLLKPGANAVSFRIRGLEFARLHLGSRDQLTFGVGREQQRLRTASNWRDLEELVATLLRERRPGTVDAHCQHYRLQAERWLESLVLKDIEAIDPRLDPNHIYPQVPAWLGEDRGMIDVLAITKQGRLAVLELKVSENMELPLQGLDYWLRVRWHQQQQEFSRKGYFRDKQVSPDSPLLYFICPQFRYHNTFPKIVGSFDRSIPIMQIGINEGWRAGPVVVVRRRLQ